MADVSETLVLQKVDTRRQYDHVEHSDYFHNAEPCRDCVSYMSLYFRKELSSDLRYAIHLPTPKILAHCCEHLEPGTVHIMLVAISAVCTLFMGLAFRSKLSLAAS